ncbi:hypothetical protein GGD81_002304 [Rhodobium orientis]|uniref:hypothetical protein n=1 Tax=Rhodobium orientis TaxID=34017 RepID=UPI00185C71E5|nr:hypothetical protein [Rhodobium orientis]MBB4303261.1 hypothetical protein [Rhodobium orientis]
MTTPDDDTPPDGFASPPCFLHELDPAYAGLDAGEREQEAKEVSGRRKAERKPDRPTPSGGDPTNGEGR